MGAGTCAGHGKSEDGPTRSTTDDSWRRSEIRHRLKPNRTIAVGNTRPWPRDSYKPVSGNPGAVHCSLAGENAHCACWRSSPIRGRSPPCSSTSTLVPHAPRPSRHPDHAPASHPGPSRRRRCQERARASCQRLSPPPPPCRPPPSRVSHRRYRRTIDHHPSLTTRIPTFEILRPAGEIGLWSSCPPLRCR